MTTMRTNNPECTYGIGLFTGKYATGIMINYGLRRLTVWLHQKTNNIKMDGKK